MPKLPSCTLPWATVKCHGNLSLLDFKRNKRLSDQPATEKKAKCKT